MGRSHFALIVELLLLKSRSVSSEAQGSECTEEKQAQWRAVRDRIHGRLPAYTGRLPWGVMTEDVEFAVSLDQDLVNMGYSNLDPPDGMDTFNNSSPMQWSECKAGMATAQLFIVLQQAANTRKENSQVVAALLSVTALAVPWVEVLLGRWPIFQILAVLRRWRQTDGPPPYASICDAAESDQAAVVRSWLNETWASRDPLDVVPSDLVASLEALVSTEATASLPKDGCRWTEHPGYFLRGYVDGNVQAFEDLGLAKAACESEPACIGVTVEDDGGSVKYTLRLGENFLETSPSEEISYVKWCAHEKEDMLKSEKSAFSKCSFGRATALIHGVFHRLENGDLGAFVPELVVDAQDSLLDAMAEMGAAHLSEELWKTTWPLWDALGRLQQRVSLVISEQKNFDKMQTPLDNARPPWAQNLQRRLGFDDEAWRLATEALGELDGELPSILRKSVHCSSKSACAAELFGRLHALMYQNKHLPLRDSIFMNRNDDLTTLYIQRERLFVYGDDDWKTGYKAENVKTRNEQLDKLMPAGHPLQVDRRQLGNFLLDSRSDIEAIVGSEPKSIGRCLEWDQPFLVVKVFGKLCSFTDVFSYSEPDPEGIDENKGLPGMHEYPYGTRHYWGDLQREDRLGIEPDTYDLILCPFVFEHVPQPFVAMQNIARIIRPGGFLIWAAPFFQRYHGAPHDYWRFTPKGALQLAASAGLQVLRMYAPGTMPVTTGVMMGMMLPYWSAEEALAESEPEEKEDVPRTPLNVFLLLRKPL